MHLLFCFFSLLLFPVFSAMAQNVDDPFKCANCGVLGGLTKLLPFIGDTGVFTSGSITVVILGWISFALALLGILAFVAFIWAGFLYITAFAGGEESVETAKKTMIWTAIGIIIILVSYTLVSTLINAIVE